MTLRPRPPPRADGNFARRSRFRPRRASRPCPRRLAPKKTPPRAPAPLAHADARRGAPCHDAGMQISRPRHRSARKMPRKPPLGLPHQQRTSNIQRALGATMKKPFAWVSQGELVTSLARPGAPYFPTSRLNDRRFGLAFVVQRSGKVRGSAGRDHRVLQKKPPKDER